MKISDDIKVLSFSIEKENVFRKCVGTLKNV